MLLSERATTKIAYISIAHVLHMRFAVVFVASVLIFSSLAFALDLNDALSFLSDFPTGYATLQQSRQIYLTPISPTNLTFTTTADTISIRVLASGDISTLSLIKRNGKTFTRFNPTWYRAIATFTMPLDEGINDLFLLGQGKNGFGKSIRGTVTKIPSRTPMSVRYMSDHGSRERTPITIETIEGLNAEITVRG